MPEVLNGKNVADFIDPDIIARLEELEAEEERLEAGGFYDDEDDVRLLLPVTLSAAYPVLTPHFSPARL